VKSQKISYLKGSLFFMVLISLPLVDWSGDWRLIGRPQEALLCAKT